MKTPTLLTIAFLATSPVLHAQILDFQPANLVLGQQSFTTSDIVDPPTSASLSSPGAIAIDEVTGKVFVVDQLNNRVLRYPNVATLTSGAGAEAVLGQSSFAGNDSNQGLSAGPNTLSAPTGLALDAAGNLWVADAGNHRILRFPNATGFSNNASATLVLGQSVMTTANSGLDQFSLDNPLRIVIDNNDRMYVADSANNRVLRYDNIASLGNGSAASIVIGQPNFTSDTISTSQNSLVAPTGVAIDDEGRLWISDGGNHRVLRFDNAALLMSNPSANAVLGQASFNTNDISLDETGFDTPLGVAVDGARLWVADRMNNRVLRFENAAEKENGDPADGVIGQPDFDTTTAAVSNRKLQTPNNVYVDSTGALWTTETLSSRILRFSPQDLISPAIKLKGKKTIRTAKRRAVLRGTAIDNEGIARVEFKAGKGKFKKARGPGHRWRAVIRPGSNKRRTVVKIRAVDLSGNRSAILRARILRK